MDSVELEIEANREKARVLAEELCELNKQNCEQKNNPKSKSKDRKKVYSSK
ncbi:hypothetical protein VP01_3265g3 [Puccinia sorghi]|uniref:Uncharacterized protein n=1 Tax=Puccinia sorghi TaxID=27349 RepID=A0A0L6UYS1_9BASI|nr:hypothetical protein VP01_3265g3 [Puccinia sorghi]